MVERRGEWARRARSDRYVTVRRHVLAAAAPFARTASQRRAAKSRDSPSTDNNAAQCNEQRNDATNEPHDDQLPPPFDDEVLATRFDDEAEDDRRIDEALEHALDGIESLDACANEPARNGETGKLADATLTLTDAPLNGTTADSSKDGSPSSDDFPQPPTPNALAYDDADALADDDALARRVGARRRGRVAVSAYRCKRRHSRRRRRCRRRRTDRRGDAASRRRRAAG